MDVARKLDVPTLLVVVNKIPHAVDEQDLRQQMVNAYGVEVAAMLPLSEDVVTNASYGLFSITHPNHPWSEQIRAIAARVTE